MILHLWMLIFIALVYLIVTAGMVLYVMSSRSGSAVVSSVLLYSSWMDMGLGIFAGAIQLVASLALRQAQSSLYMPLRRRYMTY